MKFNFKVYKAKKGNADAAYLPADKKVLVYEVNIEADNGNAAWRMLDEQIDIKRRWHVVRTVVA
jgi:hypothetical protein